MLMRSSPPPSVIPHGLVSSLRFQSACLLVGSILIPCALLTVFGQYFVFERGLANFFASEAVLHSLAAVGLGSVVLLGFLRQIERYPGVMINRHILPATVCIYAAILAIFLGLRLEYSRIILGGGFLGTVLARYIVAALAGRADSTTYLLIPGGRVNEVSFLPGISTRHLSRPRLIRQPNSALIADLHFDHDPEWERFLAEAAISGIPVYHYKQVWEAVTGKVQIEHLSENNFGALVPGLAYRKVKRIADFCASLMLLPVLAPVMGLVAILIRLDSPGPALFSQRRMGHRGQTFDVVKFRTMTVAEHGDCPAAAITLPDDQRITRIGRFLRRTRIDELPQIFNVLRGEMSWVGPRPEVVGLSRQYEGALSFYRYRHIVRPGITGWAQVNQGHVTELGQIDEKLQYDFYYIKNFSYWIDLLIVFRTVKVMLTGFGAR